QADSRRAPRCRSRDKHVVADVVNLELTRGTGGRIGVAQQEIAFAGDGAAEVADARERPIQADRAYGGRAGDRVVADVVNKHVTNAGRTGVAQYKVVRAGEAAAAAESQALPIQPPR